MSVFKSLHEEDLWQIWHIHWRPNDDKEQESKSIQGFEEDDEEEIKFMTSNSGV